MNKWFIISLLLMTSCVNVIVVGDKDGKYTVDVGYGHFHFGPNPDDGLVHPESSPPQ